MMGGGTRLDRWMGERSGVVWEEGLLAGELSVLGLEVGMEVELEVGCRLDLSFLGSSLKFDGLSLCIDLLLLLLLLCLLLLVVGSTSSSGASPSSCSGLTP